MLRQGPASWEHTRAQSSVDSPSLLARLTLSCSHARTGSRGRLRLITHSCHHNRCTKHGTISQNARAAAAPSMQDRAAGRPSSQTCCLHPRASARRVRQRGNRCNVTAAARPSVFISRSGSAARAALPGDVVRTLRAAVEEAQARSSGRTAAAATLHFRHRRPPAGGPAQLAHVARPLKPVVVALAPLLPASGTALEFGARQTSARGPPSRRS